MDLEVGIVLVDLDTVVQVAVHLSMEERVEGRNFVQFDQQEATVDNLDSVAKLVHLTAEEFDLEEEHQHMGKEQTLKLVVLVLVDWVKSLETVDSIDLH